MVGYNFRNKLLNYLFKLSFKKIRTVCLDSSNFKIIRFSDACGAVLKNKTKKTQHNYYFNFGTFVLSSFLCSRRECGMMWNSLWCERLPPAVWLCIVQAFQSFCSYVKNVLVWSSLGLMHLSNTFRVFQVLLD